MLRLDYTNSSINRSLTLRPTVEKDRAEAVCWVVGPRRSCCEVQGRLVEKCGELTRNRARRDEVNRCIVEPYNFGCFFLVFKSQNGQKAEKWYQIPKTMYQTIPGQSGPVYKEGRQPFCQDYPSTHTLLLSLHDVLTRQVGLPQHQGNPTCLVNALLGITRLPGITFLRYT